MKVYREITSLDEFDFSTSAQLTIDELTPSQQKIIFDTFDELCLGETTETKLDDFFDYETDLIAKWLGYSDFEELTTANNLFED